MPNMQPEKTKIQELAPEIRRRNFEEVCLGYTEDEARNEALRCLNCKNARCVQACPVNVRIPQFIAKISEGDFEGAYQTITATNALPAVCGRVCPQENQCEGACVRGIKGEPVAIGRLERFAADTHAKTSSSAPAENVARRGNKVAVIGAGPAGLACAGDLAKSGVEVTVFEAFHVAGGVLVYGIPEFRLPKAIVESEVENLKKLGVNFELNALVGRAETVDELLESGYDAVFLGTGAGLPSFMNVPGEEYSGVFSANEYLTRCNLMKAYRPEYDTPILKSRAVAVIGGGNVAMDAARCAMRLGADEVFIVYRRGEAELPARAEEVHHAKEEGIEFRFLTAPLEVLGDENGHVCALKCQKMQLGDPDENGRRLPVAVPGSEFILDVDTVIVAIGTTPNPLISRTTPGLETDRRGCLVTRDASTATTKRGVFAGGDAVTGAATVILAMGAGKQAAREILEYLG